MSNQVAFDFPRDKSSDLPLKASRTGSRYLGSKARISSSILDIIGRPKHSSSALVDVFSGTGAVSHQAALNGWRVIANDYLVSASIMTKARLLSEEDVPFVHLGGYDVALEVLARAMPREGFIFTEYTPEGKNGSTRERRYFTPANGRKIDGIRKQIDDWCDGGKITETEKALLIADLLSATNSVANIAGTYGCFLSHWNSNAIKPLEMLPRRLFSQRHSFSVLNQDAFAIQCAPGDVVYLDPPYTKRQYAAYYHILETIAVGDSPIVEGITGLRPWRNKSSVFCYKTKAVAALDRLVTTLSARQVFLSYSSEGHMTLQELEAVLGSHGKLTTHIVDDIGRYRPNVEASAFGASVTEYLLELEKDPPVMEIK